MLKIESLSYSFSAKPQQSLLFNDLDLEVVAGEHVVIVGDSGSGKSTLLQLIAEQNHSAISISEECRTAMILQQGALLDHLNVVDNLRLVAKYNRKAIDKNGILDLLESLNISRSLGDSSVGNLSGGQMRRVAIARALIVEPNLVLFDEPDAGLDVVNLASLALSVNALKSTGSPSTQGRVCISVSHNPIYISQVANKVYRLQKGKLVLIADWPALPQNQSEQQQRQAQLQTALTKRLDPITQDIASKPATSWVVKDWVYGSIRSLVSLVHWPRSIVDELRIARYGFYLSFVSGIFFFALVGLMLGSTTIAVVKLLADNALTGLISIFIQPEDLLDMMGGVHVLYLAPAIGGMLFAARSGSIMSNWLGEMIRGRQAQGLLYLNVPTSQYLRAPSLIAVFIAMWLTILWFALCVWYGGVITAQQLFDVSNPMHTLSIQQNDVMRSYFWLKSLIYSALVSLTVVSLGLASKTTAHQVNMHTTKAIIYSTVSIALAELIIILC